MTARGNARGIARRIARGNAHVVCARSRQSSIEGVAVGVDLPPVSQPPHAGDQGGGGSREKPASRAPSVASLENEINRVRADGGVSRGRLHLPPPGCFLKAVVHVRRSGEPTGRNRGGASRTLARISRRPRPVSETRTCIGSSKVTAFLVSGAAIGPAGPAASPRRRLQPSSGRPRWATSPHATGGEHPAPDPHDCCRAGRMRR